MSTDPKKAGGKAAAGDMVDQSKRIVSAAREREQQLSLLDPVSAEEMALAQEELGPGAGNLAVLSHARAKRRGRPPGSRNRRTDDFERYIRQFGRDPAITLMEIQSTPPEMLVERSRQIDPVGRQLSYGDANAMRVRCAEALMPYIHGKKPIAVELGVNSDFNLLIPGTNISEADARRAAEGSFVLDADYNEIEDGGE